jgi:hypothetical protein
MYHNALGFQHQSPVKERKKNPLSIHKVSSCTEGRNGSSTVSKSWVSRTNDEVKCSMSLGYHDDRAIQIQEMFPSLSREAVYDAMSRHSGDMTSCVEELLQTQEIF